MPSLIYGNWNTKKLNPLNETQKYFQTGRRQSCGLQCWHQGSCGSQVRQLCTPVTKLSFLPESCWSVPVLSHSIWSELNMSLIPFFSNVSKDIQNFIRLIIRATAFCVPQIEPTVSAYLCRAYFCRAYFYRAYVRVDHLIRNDSKTLEFLQSVRFLKKLSNTRGFLIVFVLWKFL